MTQLPLLSCSPLGEIGRGQTCRVGRIGTLDVACPTSDTPFDGLDSITRTILDADSIYYHEIHDLRYP